MNGLDPAGIRDLRELVKRLPESGVTVFLSSHLLSEVEQMATHLGIIHQGRLLFQGSLQDLQRRSGHTLIKTSNPQQAEAVLKTQFLNCYIDGDGLVSVDTSRPEEAARINEILLTSGLQVYSIENRSHRLEDFFLQLTLKASV